MLVAIGFLRTLFFRFYFRPIDLAGATEMPTYLYVHGLLTTAWFVLLVVQTRVVTGGRIRLHRSLGRIGGVLALLVVAVGMWTLMRVVPRHAIAGTSLPIVRINVFGNVALLMVFAACVGSALVQRRDPATHKRLMWIASIAMLGQATGRIPTLFGLPPGAFGSAAIIFAFPLVLMVYDLWSERRIHRATLWGLLLMVSGAGLAAAIGRSRFGLVILEALGYSHAV